jgi:hypothetical protein
MITKLKLEFKMESRPFTPSPHIFVSVASKGVRSSVSGLESTLTDIFASVDSKEVGAIQQGWPSELKLTDAYELK